MSSNRLTYDKCAYKQDLLQSVAPVDYQLDPIKYENCKKCRMELGIVSGTAISHISGNLVDLESDLRGQTRTISRCPQYDYAPSKDNMIRMQHYIKCDQTPDIDTTMKHLPSCQMIDYAEVPMAPQGKPFACAAPVPAPRR
jgi:hypothetical protein